MEVGLVQKIDIDSEMQQAYLDYAMSVIVARALPDARDGLKPVHRRILYAMYDMGLRPESPYKKSARIVGEVLGKYHPHGDMAVYESMARMAQEFSMRTMLVDGQGNFGSVDGDPPAAMRYTEARLTAPAMDLLADIQKNTVDFDPNFDGTLFEPRVLPAALPNLLVNGATGIAVGMATNIPPHNLGEVVDALKYMLENWNRLDDISVEDLMRFVQGPDFPTGGVILQEEGEEGLTGAYGTGRGRVTVKASAHLEEMERGRNRIIVTELPFMTNKASLIERIAELVRDERLVGIADLRDESDRQGMRIVIELNKTADPEAVLRELYKTTPMESTFGIMMLALVDGEPRTLSLKQALRVYLDHRLDVVRRRSEFELERARQRAHILEGLRVALKNLDEVIDMIRKAPDADTARTRLIKRFRLSEVQAQAILDMQLRRLAALERKKIDDEYKEVTAQIKSLEALLHSPVKMRQNVADELQKVKEAYGDRRRTHILHLKSGETKVSMLTTADLKPEKSVWVGVSADGLIARTIEDKPPRLGGKDSPLWLAHVSTHDTLYLVSEGGEAAAVPVMALPEADEPGAGVPVFKISALTEGDKLAALFTLPPKSERSEQGFVLTATRQGMVKKSPLSELPGPSASTFTLVKVNEGDRFGWLRLTNGQSEVLLASAEGMAIRFSEEEVRPMGLVAAGVIGIKLHAKDEVVGMDVLPKPGEVFLLAANGHAKRVPVAQFPRQGRYGQGVQVWKLSGKNRLVGMAVGKGADRVIVQLNKLAPRAIRLEGAPVKSRAAQGAQLPDFRAGEEMVGLLVPWGEFADTGTGAGPEGGPKTRKSRTGVKAEAAAGRLEPKPSQAGVVMPDGKRTAAPAVKPSRKPAPAKAVKPPLKGTQLALSMDTAPPPQPAAPIIKPAPKARLAPAAPSSKPAQPKSAPKTAAKPAVKPEIAPQPTSKTTAKPASGTSKPAPKTPPRAAPKTAAKSASKAAASRRSKAPAKKAAKTTSAARVKTGSRTSAAAVPKQATVSSSRAAPKTPAKRTPASKTKTIAKTKPVPKTSPRPASKSAPKTVSKPVAAIKKPAPSRAKKK
jgi:DNA gyrase subunit A